MLYAAIKRALSFFLFFAFLALPAVFSAEEIPWEWSGIERVVVIGDLHGDYESFIKILRGTQVVDDDLLWAAGKTHFVQTGDIMDRGPDARKILDLLIRLEKEAEAAGGMVHVLLGNHEELNLTGIVFSSNSDYVTLDQFISFLPDSYRKQQEDSLRKKITKLHAQGRRISEKQAIDAFWNSQIKDPSAQRLYVLNLNEEYGPWLRRLNVAIKINDVIFVHGGISEKYSKWGLKEINDLYRMELTDICRALRNSEPPRIIQLSIIYRSDSPLWYRELATVAEADLKEEVDAILKNLGARAMIIAHTPVIPQTPRDMQRFGGRIWIVDTGISRVYRGPASALVIQNGDFHVWGVGDENDDESDPAFLRLYRAWAGHPDPFPAAR
jgi:predicted transcriptional regulator